MNKFQKKYPKTARFISGAGKAITIAGKAYALASTVASIINSEKKWFDYTISVAPDTTASITHLSAIPAGTGASERVGESIALKSLQLKGAVYKKDSTDEVVRIIIFQDRDNNSGTAPTATQLLANPTQVYSLRNMDYPERFKVLYDNLFDTAPTYGAKVYNTFDIFKKFKTMKDNRGLKVRNQHITWRDTGGSDERRGHIYMLILGNTATASTTSNVLGYSRIRYYDN